MTRAATANLGNGTSGDVRMILERLQARGAQVVGLQEAGDRGATIVQWCRDNGWDFWLGTGPGAASTPIIWDKRLPVTHPGTTPATNATNTGRLGAGPDTVKPKVWNHVRVRPLVGPAPFVFINGHLPASLYLPRRRALAKKQVAVLTGMVKRKAASFDVVVVMDGNTFAADPIWRPLKKLGMKQHTKQATHGRRCIDLTWTLGVGGRAEVVTVPSDHRAVVLTLKEK